MLLLLTSLACLLFLSYFVAVLLLLSLYNAFCLCGAKVTYTEEAVAFHNLSQKEEWYEKQQKSPPENVRALFCSLQFLIGNVLDFSLAIRAEIKHCFFKLRIRRHDHATKFFLLECLLSGVLVSALLKVDLLCALLPQIVSESEPPQQVHCCTKRRS